MCIWVPSLLSYVLSCFSTLFIEAGSLDQTQSLSIWLVWLLAYSGDPVSGSKAGITGGLSHSSSICTGSGDLNLGPHACMVCTLTTESSPQLPYFYSAQRTEFLLFFCAQPRTQHLHAVGFAYGLRDIHKCTMVVPGCGLHYWRAGSLHLEDITF